MDSFFFFQAEDGIRDLTVTGVQTCALPISCNAPRPKRARTAGTSMRPRSRRPRWKRCTGSCCCRRRSEEHTSELQSQSNLVCRLLLEKKKNKNTADITGTHMKPPEASRRFS